MGEDHIGSARRLPVEGEEERMKRAELYGGEG